MSMLYKKVQIWRPVAVIGDIPYAIGVYRGISNPRGVSHEFGNVWYVPVWNPVEWLATNRKFPRTSLHNEPGRSMLEFGRRYEPATRGTGVMGSPFTQDVFGRTLALFRGSFYSESWRFNISPRKEWQGRWDTFCIIVQLVCEIVIFCVLRVMSGNWFVWYPRIQNQINNELCLIRCKLTMYCEEGIIS